MSTFDLDVVYERSAANIERLLAALEELQAIVRDDPRRLRLNNLLGTVEQTTGFAGSENGRTLDR